MASKEIKSSQGLKRGDPPSPLISSITIELALEKIRKTINGIIIENLKFKTLSYANSITLFDSNAKINKKEIQKEIFRYSGILFTKKGIANATTGITLLENLNSKITSMKKRKLSVLGKTVMAN
ncbi:hypothetical protein BB560_006976, partial [Smittium megazygosporum]